MYESAKELLLKMKEGILNEIIESMKEESNKSRFELGDIIDLAGDERDRELSLLLCDRDRKKIIEIEEALEKIEEGTYGICERCRKKINENRLKVMPFARLCVPCKSELEKEEPKVKRVSEGVVYRNLVYMDTDEDED
ncbi:MAG: DnaK suppressor protein [bacterium]|nr:MAG: DnaK suppressor protein [bacterium]